MSHERKFTQEEIDAHMYCIVRFSTHRRRQAWSLSTHISSSLTVTGSLASLTYFSILSMRSKHQICYAQLGRKFYYRPEEVERLFLKSGKYYQASYNNKV